MHIFCAGMWRRKKTTAIYVFISPYMFLEAYILDSSSIINRLVLFICDFALSLATIIITCSDLARKLKGKLIRLNSIFKTILCKSEFHCHVQSISVQPLRGLHFILFLIEFSIWFNQWRELWNIWIEQWINSRWNSMTINFFDVGSINVNYWVPRS